MFLEGENPTLKYPGDDAEKQIDFIICNYNKDCLNEEPVTMLFQSLGLLKSFQNQLISEVVVLIKFTSQIILRCESQSVYFSVHDSVVLYY